MNSDIFGHASIQYIIRSSKNSYIVNKVTSHYCEFHYCEISLLLWIVMTNARVFHNNERTAINGTIIIRYVIRHKILR